MSIECLGRRKRAHKPHTSLAQTIIFILLASIFAGLEPDVRECMFVTCARATMSTECMESRVSCMRKRVRFVSSSNDCKLAILDTCLHSIFERLPASRSFTYLSRQPSLDGWASSTKIPLSFALSRCHPTRAAPMSATAATSPQHARCSLSALYGELHWQNHLNCRLQC